MRVRRRIHEILESGGADDRVKAAFDLALIALIVANVAALMLETVAPIQARVGRLLLNFERLSVALFTIEYALRLWSCVEEPRLAGAVRGRLRFAARPMPLIDLFAILPFYLPFLGVDLRSIRVLRVFRFLRLLKLARYSLALQALGRVLRAKKEELLVTASFLVVLLLVSSSLMYFAEHEAQPEKFSSIPAAMWWGIATLSTVGYGDVYPLTTAGKAIASAIAVLGIGLFALPAGILGSGFTDELRRARREEAGTCPHCGKPMAGAAADKPS